MTVFTSTVKWLGSLTGVFLKNAPIATITVVLMTLFSQLAMMMAFLMPLKVVMLLGSEGIPRFFPKALLEIDRNTLIISLVILSITSYIASALFEYISEKNTERGVKRLQEKTQKIILFENQDNIASNAYTKYSAALAGLIFALTAISFFFVFYQDVAVLTVSFLLLVLTIIYILYVSSQKLEALINKKAGTISSSISNVGFLLIFLYIVVDFLYLAPPDFMVALATIIIGRLMLVRLGVSASNLFSLRQDQGKINALFFHHHAFIPTDAKRQKTVWDLLAHSYLLTWVTPVLEEATLQSLDQSDIIAKWRQTRLNNIVVLQAKVKRLEKTFLIKVFEERITSQALHESTLIVNIDNKLFPCPPFLLSTMVGNYHCHVFDITNFEFLSPMEAIKLDNEINKKLFSLSPSEELTERYKRSKVFLWERIEKAMTDRLQLVASEQDWSIIQKVESAIPEIRAILRSLPLCFVNHKLNNTSLLRTSENQVVSFHWPTWIIEPAGFDLQNDNRLDMEGVIQAASEYRTELNQFPVESYELAALMSAFERYFHQQQYENVIGLCHLIIDKLERLN